MIRITFWTASFLILLRVAIGWHFFFEGLNKIKSAYAGPAEISKPFSSEAYFRESEGPIGPIMRKYMGEPDEELFAKLNADLTTAEIKSTEFPAALETEWTQYLNSFASTFGMNEEKQTAAKTKILEPLKAAYLDWLAGKIIKKSEAQIAKDDPLKALKTKLIERSKTTKSYGGVSIETYPSLPERVADYVSKRKAARDAVDEKMWMLGRDVEKVALRTKKADVISLRTELNADIAEFTVELRDRLAKLVASGFAGFSLPIDKAKFDLSLDETLIKILTAEKPEANELPEEIKKQWDAYILAVKEFNSRKVSNQTEVQPNTTEILKAAATRFNRYLRDQDEFTGVAKPESTSTVKARLDVYRKLVADQKITPTPANQTEILRIRQTFLDEIKRHTETVKTEIGGPTSEQQKGYVEVESKPKNVENIDRMTRWFLTIVGSCLIFGVFTRISALAAAGFLIMTYLAQPSFPWLPSPPISEGNYVFVNKNVVECLALFVLATVPTGRWLGIDGLIYYVFGPKQKVKKQKQSSR
jgi:uncharacterized membrane protein YphA (DoxX/SURF4 family)